MDMKTHIITASIFIFYLFLKVHADRSFIIDYENNQFLKDGEPYRYISGSMHYFRVPSIYWQDRLNKMKAAGLNTVQIYVDWSQHEPEPGVYNFEGNLDIVSFLTLANTTGMNVVLRPGPFIDAERDFGGLPYWLFRENPDMVIRSSDPSYLNFVDIFFTKLFGLVQPLLYANGGPIITVQIENEYGSYYTCDADYLNHLRDLTRSLLGNDIVLFTTDGAGDGYLQCGKIQDVYATVDFGPGSDVDAAFQAQRDYEPQGPLVNSEFYTGWLDHWGDPHEHEDPNSVRTTLDQILAKNASVNMYMFHGGTSYAFTAGSNMGNTYQACPTSYDYDAPLSEAGDTSNVYFVIREVLSKYVEVNDPVPANVSKYSYGSVELQASGSLFELLPQLTSGEIVNSDNPLTFEAIGQAYGFILYETVIQEDHANSVLNIDEIRDRAYVYVNQEPVGLLSREDQITSLTISVVAGDKLSIFVENQGHICYGSSMASDFKGIYSNVLLDDVILTEWTMTPVSLNNTASLMALQPAIPGVQYATYVPVVYVGEFTIPEELSEPQDTFLNPQGWQKGVAFINGFNLGRYWPVRGPQITLYVPKSVLLPYPQTNQIVLFEQEQGSSTSIIQFDSVSQIDGPTS